MLRAAGRVPCSSVMSVALLYSLVRFLLDALLTRRQSELRLRAEVLALRQQLRVLERQVRRPRWQPADRLLLTALSRILPCPVWSALLVSPETLLRWHRELIHGKWAAYARCSPHPDRARPSELHQLILHLARKYQHFRGGTTSPQGARGLARENWPGRTRAGGIAASRVSY